MPVDLIAGGEQRVQRLGQQGLVNVHNLVSFVEEAGDGQLITPHPVEIESVAAQDDRRWTFATADRLRSKQQRGPVIGDARLGQQLFTQFVGFTAQKLVRPQTRYRQANVPFAGITAEHRRRQLHRRMRLLRHHQGKLHI